MKTKIWKFLQIQHFFLINIERRNKNNYFYHSSTHKFNATDTLQHTNLYFILKKINFEINYNILWKLSRNNSNIFELAFHGTKSLLPDLLIYFIALLTVVDWFLTVWIPVYFYQYEAITKSCESSVTLETSFQNSGYAQTVFVLRKT